MDVHYPAMSADDDGDADGPPPPPFVRERAARRRRRRWIVIGAVLGVLLFVGVPLLAAGGLLPFQDGGSEAGDPDGAPGGGTAPGQDDGDPGEPAPSDPDDGGPDGEGGSSAGDPGSRPDREVPSEEEIRPPNLEELDADEARIAELLLDIDASERVMLTYQLDAQDAFGGGLDPDEPEELFSELRAAARTAVRDLEVLRERLAVAQADPAADDVRQAYAGHLQAWLDYLEAVDDDPQIVLGELTRYTIDINRTGDDFARAVDALLLTDIDPDVANYAQRIVERGFSGPETPQA